ncbi:lipopolysaccharide assembly protein LapB [Reinekea sp. G2M2-21]|uniref:tetratricopeptide repeat protein n=1 Tax=Reinekea sp. G2M2-21 TaxID=2788942 RepID=UPI0018A954DA|nr:hypothetical protein [Reinekea sp. G2M2-21]
MSAIHQALRQTDSDGNSVARHNFNPLTQQKTASRHFISYYLLGCAFLVIAVGIVFWPQSQSAPVAINVIDSQVATTPGSIANDTKVLTDNGMVINSTDESEPTTLVTEAFAVTTAKDRLTATPIVQSSSENVEKNSETRQISLDSSPTLTVSTEATSNDGKKTKAAQPAIPQAPLETEDNTENDKPKTDASATTPTDATTTSLHGQTTSVITVSTNTWQENVTAYISRGEIEQAEAELKRWISASPKDSVPRIWLAKIYINNGVYRAAEPLIETINNNEAKALLGIAYERTSRPALAAAIFEELYRADSSEGKWLLFWAVNTENSGQLAKSLALYQNYLQVFPADDANLSNFAQQRVRVIQRQ